jgi:hypothetical protein
MGNKTRFSIAKQDIIQYFNESAGKIYALSDISEILNKNRKFWRLTNYLTTDKFIELLINGTELKKHKLKFSSTEFTRYSWGKIDIINLALSLKKGGHLSHYSAISYHGLTEQIPKTVYISFEQSKKDIKSRELEQSQIDSAFANPTKLSNNYTVYDEQKIFLLNGMYTNQLGVETDTERNVRVTNLERTLIDIAIRPEYSGGIFEVVKAYESASQIVSVNKMMSYLKKMNFIYPYHQCIGFYMMATRKYRDNQLELLRKLDKPMKFYLTHGIEEKSFSEEWNLYYPANFQF